MRSILYAGMTCLKQVGRQTVQLNNPTLADELKGPCPVEAVNLLKKTRTRIIKTKLYIFMTPHHIQLWLCFIFLFFNSCERSTWTSIDHWQKQEELHLPVCRMKYKFLEGTRRQTEVSSSFYRNGELLLLASSDILWVLPAKWLLCCILKWHEADFYTQDKYLDCSGNLIRLHWVVCLLKP